MLYSGKQKRNKKQKTTKKKQIKNRRKPRSRRFRTNRKQRGGNFNEYQIHDLTRLFGKLEFTKSDINELLEKLNQIAWVFSKSYNTLINELRITIQSNKTKEEKQEHIRNVINEIYDDYKNDEPETEPESD